MGSPFRKTCSKCGVTKDRAKDFSDRAGGEGRKRGVCRQCRNGQAADQYRLRKNPPAMTGTKTCRLCKTEKPVIAFHEHPSCADGRQTRCKECMRAYVRRLHAERDTTRWIGEYKRGKSCSRCPESHPSCLDFHHLEAHDRLHRINHIQHHGTLEQMIDEVKKCVLLCANCHRKDHYGAE